MKYASPIRQLISVFNQLDSKTARKSAIGDLGNSVFGDRRDESSARDGILRRLFSGRTQETIIVFLCILIREKVSI
jgi:hypothetical protein